MDTAIIDRMMTWCSTRKEGKDAMNLRFSKYLDLYKQKINFEIIKITGTNGKGSVASMLSSCLIKDGKNVGLFTSPHLNQITERFRINDNDITLNEFLSAINVIEIQTHNFVDVNGKLYIPSFFEILILIGLEIFNKHNIDIAVFECGVGGSNDATSLLPSKVSLITSIGLDHVKQLGNRLEDIAIDKAGIANNDTTLFVNSKIKSNLKELIFKRSLERNVTLIESKNYITFFESQLTGTDLELNINNINIKLKPTLFGDFQQQNINLVIECWLYLINIGLASQLNSISGIENTRWSARFEVYKDNNIWIFDSAHNAEAFNELINSLDKVSYKKDRILLFGNSEEKDFVTITKLINKISTNIYLIDDFYKSIPQNSLLNEINHDYINNIGKSKMRDVIEDINKSQSNKIIVVAGSIFMVGAIRKIILDGKG
jgi:dihydrofolate synthase / folylpolyglutamate synthase